MVLTRSNKNIGGVQGITPTQHETRRSALLGLAEALAPHLKPRFEVRVREFESHLASDDPEVVETLAQLHQLAHGALLDEGMSEAEIAAHVAETDHLRRNPEDVDPALRAEQQAQEFQHACLTIVTQWIGTLYETVRATNGGATAGAQLDAATLDEAMLPAVFAAQRHRWAHYLEQTLVNLDDALVALRAFRAALPDGKRLPDRLVALLTTHGITVQNV